MSKTITEKQVEVLRHHAACQEPYYLAQGLRGQRLAAFTKAVRELQLAELLDGHVVTPTGYVELAARGWGDPCAHCGGTKFEATKGRTRITCIKCLTVWRRDKNGEGWFDASSK